LLSTSYVFQKSQSSRKFPYGYLVTTSLQLLKKSWSSQYRKEKNCID
jgi:hypothetical protein